MKKLFFFMVMLLFIFFVYAEEKTLKMKENEIIDEIRKVYPRLNEERAKEFYKMMEYHHQIMIKQNNQTILKDIIVPFNCQTFSRSQVNPPTNVHDLKLPYVDIIGAIGDSITAAFGAKSWWIFNMLTEYRGVSWSIGGDSSLSGGVLTLPNLIRRYNPSLYGFSTGTGSETSSNAVFNQAVSGAVCSDLFGQAVELYKLMRIRSDMNTTYKIITVFIGGNDLCAACTDWDKYSKSNYERHLRDALTFLKNNFPNTIVNLVPAIDVTELAQLRSGLCDVLHYFECDCYTNPFIPNLQKEYVAAAMDVANDPFFTTDTFTVVLQPFMNNTFVPQSGGAPDMSFFALDCFHLSEKGHQAATVPLWNNMFERIGQKLNYWEGPREQFECPTPDDFIWTSRNSIKK